MSNPFEIISQFLEKFDDDVAGRAVEEPPAEVQAQFRDFARGTIDDESRDRIVGLLKEHPGWIPALVREAKSLRPPSAGDQA